MAHLRGRRSVPPHPWASGSSARTYHWRTMGFNPFREQKKTTIDVLLVVLFVVITGALVAWGFLG